MLIREGTARQLGLWGQDVFYLTREGALTQVTEQKPVIYRLRLPTPRTHGEWLRLYRMKAGLRKIELASQAGIDAKTVNRYEADRQKIWVMSLYCMLRVLGVRLAEHIARVEGQDLPEPLPLKARVGLQDAIANTRIAMGLRLNTDCPTPRIETIRAACLDQNIDQVEFWLHVDSMLGEMP